MIGTVVNMRRPDRPAGPLPPWWTPCIVLLVIVVLQAILFVSVIEVGRALDADGFVEKTPSGWLALYSVIKNAVLLLVLFIAVRVWRADTSATLRLRRVSARSITLSCLMILSLVPWDMYLVGHLRAERMMIGADTSHFNAALMMSWMSLVLLTPVAEELLFRGFALTVFGKKSILIGLLGSGALYGCYHFDGSFGSVITPIPFALVTAYGVVTTGSVYPVILAHAVWNLLAVLPDVRRSLPPESSLRRRLQA